MQSSRKSRWLGFLAIIIVGILGGLAYIWATPETDNANRSDHSNTQAGVTTTSSSTPQIEDLFVVNADAYIYGHLENVDLCNYSIELRNEDLKDRQIVITTNFGSNTILLPAKKSSFRANRLDGATWVDIKTTEGKLLMETKPYPTRFDDVVHDYVERFYPYSALECQNGTLPGK